MNLEALTLWLYGCTVSFAVGYNLMDLALCAMDNRRYRRNIARYIPDAYCGQCGGRLAAHTACK